VSLNLLELYTVNRHSEITALLVLQSGLRNVNFLKYTDAKDHLMCRRKTVLV